MEEGFIGTNVFNSLSDPTDPWRSLPDVRWRALVRREGNVPPPVLEQKWVHIHTKQTVWRVVPTALIGVTDGDEVDEVDDGPSTSTSATVPAIMDDLMRLRQATEAIRPHAVAWMALLEAYVHSLPEASSAASPSRRDYAEHELAAMRSSSLTALLSI